MRPHPLPLLCFSVLSLAACAPLPVATPPLPTATAGHANTATTTATALATTAVPVATTTATVTPIPSVTPSRPTPAATRNTVSASPTAAVVLTTTLPLTAHLTADHLNLVPDEPVSLTWTSNGSAASQAHLKLYSDGGSQPIQTWIDLPPNGSLQATIPGAQARDRYFFMFVISENEQWADSSVQVALPCPDEFFFDRTLLVNSTVCPASPASYPAAVEQVFEGGRMLWLQPENRIYVFYNNVSLPRALEIFENPWQAGEPENDPALTPPPDRWQPTRGFGAIWRGETTPLRGWLNVVVREQLGWAVGPEITFTSADQSEWITGIVRQECLATRFPCTPFRYLRLSDGRIIKYTFNVKPADVPFWLDLTP